MFRFPLCLVCTQAHNLHRPPHLRTQIRQVFLVARHHIHPSNPSELSFESIPAIVIRTLTRCVSTSCVFTSMSSLRVRVRSWLFRSERFCCGPAALLLHRPNNVGTGRIMSVLSVKSLQCRCGCIFNDAFSTTPVMHTGHRGPMHSSWVPSVKIPKSYTMSAMGICIEALCWLEDVKSELKCVL